MWIFPKKLENLTSGACVLHTISKLVISHRSQDENSLRTQTYFRLSLSLSLSLSAEPVTAGNTSVFAGQDENGKEMYQNLKTNLLFCGGSSFPWVTGNG